MDSGARKHLKCEGENGIWRARIGTWNPVIELEGANSGGREERGARRSGISGQTSESSLAGERSRQGSRARDGVRADDGSKRVMAFPYTKVVASLEERGHDRRRPRNGEGGGDAFKSQPAAVPLAQGQHRHSWQPTLSGAMGRVQRLMGDVEGCGGMWREA